MAKTLKQFLEGYAPRSDDEKRFIDKHVVVKHADRNGNGDDVFKAKKIKTIKRSPEHGHEVGKDHEVYEEVEVEDLAEVTQTPQKGDVRVADYGKGMGFYVLAKNKEAHAAATARVKELKNHRRRGVEHPELGRIPRGADISDAEDKVSGLVHVLKEDTVDEGYSAEQRRKSKDAKSLRQIQNGYANQKSGKWKSVSYQLPDGRWASKDVKEETEQLDEHRGYKAPELEAAGYKFKSHMGGSEPSTLYHHPELDKHIEIVHERTGISGAKKRHVFFSGKFAGGMQTRHLNLADAIAKNAGKLNEETIEEGQERLRLNYPFVIHTKDEKGRDAGKIRINALSQEAAEKRANEIVGQKPYRGKTVHKVVKEDVEQVDELDISTLANYRNKARDAKQDHEDERDYWKSHDEPSGVKDMNQKIARRTKGIRNANKRLKEIDDLHREEYEPILEARDPQKRPHHFVFTHTPGDKGSEAKLANLKKMVKGHNSKAAEEDKLRVVARGRLGENNPHAEKYRKGGEVWNKRSHGKWGYRDADKKDWGPLNNGERSRGYTEVSMKHAKHHDIYVSPASFNGKMFTGKRPDYNDYKRQPAKNAAVAIAQAHRALHEEKRAIGGLKLVSRDS